MGSLIPKGHWATKDLRLIKGGMELVIPVQREDDKNSVTWIKGLVTEVKLTPTGLPKQLKILYEKDGNHYTRLCNPKNTLRVGDEATKVTQLHKDSGFFFTNKDCRVGDKIKQATLEKANRQRNQYVVESTEMEAEAEASEGPPILTDETRVRKPGKGARSKNQTKGKGTVLKDQEKKVKRTVPVAGARNKAGKGRGKRLGSGSGSQSESEAGGEDEEEDGEDTPKKKRSRIVETPSDNDDEDDSDEEVPYKEPASAKITKQVQIKGPPKMVVPKDDEEYIKAKQIRITGEYVKNHSINQLMGYVRPHSFEDPDPEKCQVMQGLRLYVTRMNVALERIALNIHDEIEPEDFCDVLNSMIACCGDWAKTGCKSSLTECMAEDEELAKTMGDGKCVKWACYRDHKKLKGHPKPLYFWAENAYEKHVMEEHMIPPSPYFCLYCQKEFLIHNELRNHIEAAHPTGSFPLCYNINARSATAIKATKYENPSGEMTEREKAEFDKKVANRIKRKEKVLKRKLLPEEVAEVIDEMDKNYYRVKTPSYFRKLLKTSAQKISCPKLVKDDNPPGYSEDAIDLDPLITKKKHSETPIAFVKRFRAVRAAIKHVRPYRNPNSLNVLAMNKTEITKPDNKTDFKKIALWSDLQAGKLYYKNLKVEEFVEKRKQDLAKKKEKNKRKQDEDTEIPDEVEDESDLD